MHLTYVQHRGCATRMLTMTGNTSVFVCPDCSSIYQENTWLNRPLPCPFVEQVNVRCAIVIKPTRGFFQSYQMGDDLHVGISDSRSNIHSYWTNGITSEVSSWDRSIIIYQFENESDNWFDRSLANFIDRHSHCFLAQRYNETDWNCFDFVMEFLRFTNCRTYTKVDFVAEFVQDALQRAMKYRSLVNKVEERGSILVR